MQLEKHIEDKIQKWLQGPYDEAGKKTIQNWLENKQFQELNDSFYKNLEFGTGGLRGELGPGPNRMNIDTVGMATQGFANYLHSQYDNLTLKVVISYDSRHGSAEFAKHVAKVFSANDFHVYLFQEMRPTPLLSYAIRKLQAHAGVMITASHNPKEYNGYKAYWKDGGQLLAPHDKGVMDQVQFIKDPSQVRIDHDLKGLTFLGEDLDIKYLEEMYDWSIHPVKDVDLLKIVYSPIHGTGITLVPKILKKWGFEQVHIVEEQAQPDGDFPTVIYPNPEEAEAMSRAISLAKDTQADLVLATDPDTDRVGLAIPTENGEYLLLNGNQMGSLLIHYVLEGLASKSKLKENDYIVKTIVTTGLIDSIAAKFSVDCHNVLTGFKYIGELMTQRENSHRFLVGGEESYGYLVGDSVRDKDAVISCALFAEMTYYYKSQNLSLFDVLKNIYKEHGFYLEKLISITKKGEEGAKEINKIMNSLRENHPDTLGGIAIEEIRDYKVGKSYSKTSHSTSILDLPSSNVLQFISTEGDIISARPSGTEPKIKFYCSVKENWVEGSNYAEMLQKLSAKIDKMMSDLISL